jgi:hypothetical protein
MLDLGLPNAERIGRRFNHHSRCGFRGGAEGIARH